MARKNRRISPQDIKARKDQRARKFEKTTPKEEKK